MNDYNDWGTREVIERLTNMESKVQMLIRETEEKINFEGKRVIIDRSDKITSDERMESLQQTIVNLKSLL